MHGEGDLLSRLATVGYQVSHVQTPLAEHDFRAANLIENLRDGDHLCRLVQILLQDTSAQVMLPKNQNKADDIEAASNKLMCRGPQSHQFNIGDTTISITENNNPKGKHRGQTVLQQHL